MAGGGSLILIRRLPNNVFVEVGAHVTLECEILFLPPPSPPQSQDTEPAVVPRVTWYKNRVPLIPGGTAAVCRRNNDTAAECDTTDTECDTSNTGCDTTDTECDSVIDGAVAAAGFGTWSPRYSARRDGDSVHRLRIRDCQTSDDAEYMCEVSAAVPGVGSGVGTAPRLTTCCELFVFPPLEDVLIKEEYMEIEVELECSVPDHNGNCAEYHSALR